MPNDKREYMFRAPESLAQRKSYGGKKKKRENKYRTEFMRDRDRIMYCRSFRRLGGKTQIYRVGGNDHQRNRLTHTLEVAQISRTIAIALDLDCDLAEAIALGHDLGHAPFGHAGEEILDKIMTPGENNPIDNSPLKITAESNNDQQGTLDEVGSVFGFKHNIQSVRIISEIDNSYQENGLDLTNFTLWGIMNHSDTTYGGRDECNYKKTLEDVMRLGKKLKSNRNHEAWSFEAFVVKQADEIAQWHHDLEDALRGNAITPETVCDIINKALEPKLKNNSKERNMLKKLRKRKHVDQIYLTQMSHIVIEMLMQWLIDSSQKNLSILEEHFFKDDKSMKNVIMKYNWREEYIQKAIGFRLLNVDGKIINEEAVDNLESSFRNQIHERIHHSQDVERMNAKGKFIIERLFASYYAAPQQLPTGVLIQFMLDYGRDNNGTRIIESWDDALSRGSGEVRIKFKEIYSEPSKALQIGLMRKICDHIAGMTDHFALEEYKNLYG